MKGGGIGGFGSGWIERLRQWLGAQWTGLALGVSSCPEPPGAPWGGAGAELGRWPDCTLTMHRHEHAVGEEHVEHLHDADAQESILVLVSRQAAWRAQRQRCGRAVQEGGSCGGAAGAPGC